MRLQTKPMIKQLILLGSFYLLLSPALGWTSEGEDTFSSVMQQTATELASQYKGKQPLHLLISQNYFRMKRTGENLPLSSFVEEEMKTKLVQTGKFILSHAYEEGKKQGILVGNYYREPGKIVFHLSILSEQETILSAAKASIHDQAIPSKWLQNEIPRKAIEIVQKISDKFTAQKKSVLLKEPIKVYVENIPDSKGRFSAFSSQFRQEIIHAMTGNFNFKVTAKRDIASVPTHRIKTRKMIVTEKSSPGTMMAQQIQAGAVLRGTYMKVGKTLRVNMELVDPVGNFLSSEGISIGLDIIKVAYQTKKEKESSPTQTNTLPSKLKLVLNLDKGDGSVYKVGEKVRVLIPHPESSAAALQIRAVRGGLLVQETDNHGADESTWQVVTRRVPSEEERRALAFAWVAVKHVRSNAIVIARGTATIGIGGGETNRVDAVRLAVGRAGENARGAVLASDAFFPFPDGLETAAEAGVTAFIQPGGSIRDEEVIAAADRCGATMVFTGERHFRH